MDAVETAAYANTPAWHHKGNVLDTLGELGMDVPTALAESGLDWTVSKVPIFAAANDQEDPLDAAKGGLIPIEGRYGVKRSTDGAILGVVGDVWEPVQNLEGFKLIEDFMQGGTAYIEAAGSLYGGKKVWVLAHMTEDLQIAGETIWPYVLFTNGHDGRTSVTAAMTDVRVECANLLTFALGKAKRKISIRHTVKATERMAEAKRLLGLRDLYSEELAKQGEWLVSKEMSDKQFNTFLEKLMPIEEKHEGKPAETMITGRRDQVRDVYMTADNLNNIRGTRWGALNAVVEYADYGRPFKNEETQLKAQFESAPIKDQARDLLLTR